jgi:glycosyltransferase involved in cell wall biosynthesis
MITSVAPGRPLPDWIELTPGGRPVLAGLLSGARVCVIPLPLTRYTDLAVPVRLADLVAFGKPIIVTDSVAVRAYLGSSGAAMLVVDTADAIAAAIGRIFRDDDFAAGLARSARAFAEAPSSTWSGRAATVVSSLVAGAA